ncbi:serine/threonine-protein kinase gin4 [Tilletia horrida]|nr:serine/threonine-protein kinase gin4 [Tilletia horrida]
MSSIRTPIAPIPPFKGHSSSSNTGGGGPLQPRTAPTQATADRPGSVVAERTAKLQAVIKESGKHAASSGKDYDPTTGRRTHASSAASGSAATSSSTAKSSSTARSSENRSHTQQSSSKPRPQTRLEREKKKDYKDPANIGPWKLGKIIGQGASGRVRYAQHASTGQQAAIKIIPRNALVNSRMSLREAGAKQNKLNLGIEREILIMKLIEHPNIIGLWDVYETSTELYLVMEYVAGGELFDHLVARGKLSSSEARSYFRQIIYGLDYCHRFNICHRDLKPENLLLDSTKRGVKIADFGMAALQPSEKMLETSCGSPHYASPEIVSGKSYKGSASDIWSCGIILFALLCGRLPFDDPNLAELLKKVRSGKFHMPEEVEPSAKGLIWRMLEVDPARRITMPDIMRHPWFTHDGREPARNPVTTSFADIAQEAERLFAAGRDGVDQDILRNLRTLMPELSEEYIIDQLLCAGTNWQKTFYTLIALHREEHSADDDNEDEGDFDEQVNAQGQSVPVGAPGTAVGSASIKEKARPRRSVEAHTPAVSPTKPRSPDKTMKDGAPVPVPVPAPAPASAPTPAIAPTTVPSGRSSPTKPAGPRAQASRTSLRERTKESSTTRSASAQSAAAASSKIPSAPAGAAGSASSKRDSAHSQRPGSTLRPDENTPLQTQSSPRVNARTSSRAASPTKALGDAPASSSVSVSASKRMSGTPVIAVPQVGDATVQRFFQEIADELALIRATGPSTSGHGSSGGSGSGENPQSDALQAKLDKLRSTMGAAASAAEAPPSTPVIPDLMLHARSPPIMIAPAEPNHNTYRGGEDANRFDDADDDVTSAEEAAGLLSSGAADGRTAPLAISGKPSAQASSSYASSSAGTSPNPAASSSGWTARKPVPHSRPGSAMSHHSGVDGSASTSSSTTTPRSGGSKIKAAAALREWAANTSISPSSSPAAVVGKENAGRMPAPSLGAHLQAKGLTRLQKKNPGLGLDIGLAPTVSVSAPVSPGATNSPNPAALLALPSPNPSVSTASSSIIPPSPKQSWFAGLFNWKPASCTLYSTEALGATTTECRRLLHSYGVRTVLEDAESELRVAVLKCISAEVRDPSGTHVVSKPVRFRVEFNLLPVGSPVAPTSGSASAGPSSSLSAASPVPGTPRSSVLVPASPALSAGGSVRAASIRSGTTAASASGSGSGSGSGSSAGGGSAMLHGVATSMTLLQEKGALSTFKGICVQLRRDWELDTVAPPSPALGYPASPRLS